MGLKTICGMKFNTRHTYILGFFLLAAILMVPNLLPASTQEPENPPLGSTDPVYHQKFLDGYQIMPPPLPDSLSFAGERVPLDFYLCRERLDRELMVNIFWQSNQLLLLKRANRYFPKIEAILKEEGIPDDFKYLCVIESGMMNVVSPAKAAGFWQLMTGTARDHGLEVNTYIDERYNLEKATRAACEYLKMLYERFGSWTLAAAAYNTGQSNMDYHLRTQGTNDYYQLHLPEETSRYMYRILAEKLVEIRAKRPPAGSLSTLGRAQNPSRHHDTRPFRLRPPAGCQLPDAQALQSLDPQQHPARQIPAAVLHFPADGIIPVVDLRLASDSSRCPIRYLDFLHRSLPERCNVCPAGRFYFRISRIASVRRTKSSGCTSPMFPIRKVSAWEILPG